MTSNTPNAAANVAGILLEPGGLERIQLSWRLFRDGRVAPVAKLAIPVLVALYLISPVDLIPDFLLGLGQFDDLGLIALALAFTLRVFPRLAPPAVVAEHLSSIRGVPVQPEAAAQPTWASDQVVDARFNVR